MCSSRGDETIVPLAIQRSARIPTGLGADDLDESLRAPTHVEREQGQPRSRARATYSASYVAHPRSSATPHASRRSRRGERAPIGAASKASNAARLVLRDVVQRAMRVD
jgi:hypothetical protein